MLNRIGKYELRGMLGKGSSATVYLGLDTFAGTEVAVKVLEPGVFRDPNHGEILRSQFLNEASLVGKLNHPHIVAILDAVVTDDSGYIAMEYVRGGNLAHRTRAQNLFSVEEAIQVGFKCCGALDYAFRQGVIHRDIKPANVMVANGTDIKVTDFGAVYLRDNAVPATRNIGSPAYMSPEQLSGAPLTHQSDMFSWAIVLYELLTGQRPFVAQDIDSLIQKVLHEETVPPSRVRPGLPPEIDRMLVTALRKNPAERFPTWADFALELAKIGRLSVYQQTIQDAEKVDALARIEMLAKLDRGEIAELVQAGRWSRLPARHVIIRENEVGQSLFFLAKGQAKAMRQGRLLNLIGAGECFGEMAFMRGGKVPRHASVESLTEVLVAEFDDAALARLSSNCQLQFTRALVRTLAERLELANVRLAQTSG